MKLNWKWIAGICAALILIVISLAWRFFMPHGSGYGMMNQFGMFFMWLIPLGAFILIGFAFGWAANQFTRKSS